MILAGGKPLPAEFSAGLDAVSKAALDAMQADDGKLSYDSPEQLAFELAVRSATVASALRLYRSGMDFAVFRKSRCNEAYWRRTREGGFVLRDGASPSAAIRDIFENGRAYATECATAMVIVFYGALLEVLGDAAFDRMFPRIELMDWHYLYGALGSLNMMTKRRIYLPGDRRYFANPDVDPSTPEWQGENVIELGDGRFYGHGVGVYPAEGIVRALNRNRERGADTSAYLMDAASRPDYKALFTAYQQGQRARA